MNCENVLLLLLVCVSAASKDSSTVCGIVFSVLMPTCVTCGQQNTVAWCSLQAPLSFSLIWVFTLPSSCLFFWQLQASVRSELQWLWYNSSWWWSSLHTFMMMSYSVCCCCVGDWCFNWTPMPAQTCSFSIVSSGEVPPADFTDSACQFVSLRFMHNVRRDDECSSSLHASSSIWRLAKGHHWKEGKETEKCQRWNGSLVSDCLLAIFIIMIAFFVLSTLAGIPANFRDRRRKRKLWRPRQLAVRHSLFWALFPSHCHLPFHGSFYLVLS